MSPMIKLQDLIEMVLRQKPRVIALHGEPGSGKSYIAERLAELGYEILSSDDFGFRLQGGRRDYYGEARESPRSRQAAHDVLEDAAYDLVNQGRFVAIDRTHTARKHVRATEMIAKDTSLLWVKVHCDYGTLLGRYDARPEGLAYWVEVLERMRESGPYPEVRGVTVDGSKRW